MPDKPNQGKDDLIASIRSMNLPPEILDVSMFKHHEEFKTETLRRVLEIAGAQQMMNNSPIFPENVFPYIALYYKKGSLYEAYPGIEYISFRAGIEQILGLSDDSTREDLARFMGDAENIPYTKIYRTGINNPHYSDKTPLSVLNSEGLEKARFKIRTEVTRVRGIDAEYVLKTKRGDQVWAVDHAATEEVENGGVLSFGQLEVRRIAREMPMPMQTLRQAYHKIWKENMETVAEIENSRRSIRRSTDFEELFSLVWDSIMEKFAVKSRITLLNDDQDNSKRIEGITYLLKFLENFNNKNIEVRIVNPEDIDEKEIKDGTFVEFMGKSENAPFETTSKSGALARVNAHPDSAIKGCVDFFSSDEGKWGEDSDSSDLARLVESLHAKIFDLTTDEATRETLRNVQTIIAEKHKLAHTDTRTGVPNDAGFNEYMEKLLDPRRFRRQIEKDRQYPITVAMMDIDFFKKFNDKYGHLAGDEVLRTFAQHLKKKFGRDVDFVARYGGEEFVAVIVDTPEKEVLRLLEEFREEVSKMEIYFKNKKLGKVTVSIGVTSTVFSATQPTSQEDLVDAADQALYKAKGQGRDQIVVAPKKKSSES